MPPSDETIYQELIKRGHSPENARIAVEDSAPKVGREPPSDETVYQELIKRGHSPENAAIAVSQPTDGPDAESTLTITGLPPVVEPAPAGGATWQDFIPQPPQPAVPPPAVPPESRPGDTIAGIVDKEEDQGYFQGPAETVASLGGILAGALKGPLEFGL